MDTNAFERRLSAVTAGGLCSTEIRALQVNLALRRNQQCRHCHVQASPQRTEAMDWPTMDQVVQAARATDA